MRNYGRSEAKEAVAKNGIDSCHRTKSQIKKSIRERRDDINLLREVLARDLGDYNKVNETIGRVYMNIVYLKEELKQLKGKK